MVPSRGTLPVTPRLARQLQALIFYAGDDVREEFHKCFSHIADEFSACHDFYFSVALHVTEVDLLKGGSNLLTADAAARRLLLSSCRSSASIIVALPAHRSFSRRRHTNYRGPRPLRDRFWLRGLPELTAVERCCVDNENIIADCMVDVVKAGDVSNSSCLALCPEDLGKAARGWPASFWQWPSLRSAAVLLSSGALSFSRVGHNQQCLGPQAPLLLRVR